MKIFLDSADSLAIIKRYATGLIDGVTTNPSLIAKTPYTKAIDVILNITDGCSELESVSIEVHPSAANDPGAMLNEALDYRAHKAITTKLPCTPAGLQVCRELKERGQKTNITLVFSVAQAILAAKAGATYVSPFVGRTDDNSYDGVKLVRDIAAVYREHMVTTQILAASIRSVSQVSELFAAGADIVTMPVEVFDKMYDHILTKDGLEKFKKDAEKLQG